VPVAIALTAIVHLANNLFKLALVGRHAHGKTVLRFGIPAVIAALAGASLLQRLGALAPLARYEFLGAAREITPEKLCIAVLLAVFAVLETLPAFTHARIPPRWMPLGGALSGFFGGLSGQQGALRSAFLMRAGLSKEAFLGTGVVLACLIDLTRIPLYSAHLEEAWTRPGLLAAAVLSAWIGAFFGARLFRKATYASVQRVVAALLIVTAALLGAGIL
jgi:uncharacterized membrane protein YfcA